MNDETHYAVLGVVEDAAPEEIRKAFRARCADYHPDGIPDDREELLRYATERMTRVIEAWQVLQDPGRRRAYDASLRARRPGASVSQAPDLARGPIEPSSELAAAMREAEESHREAEAQRAAAQPPAASGRRPFRTLKDAREYYEALDARKAERSREP